ncbi:MAG TPA: DUF1015 family protein [Bacteroidia bacterium]|nr:DUF1015 family protein [Bacteroidia bacterium]HNT80631.1 DUF1015 family protein [Bacteroidia bacterium]
MAIIKAFKGIRPKNNLAQKIASKPYDVLNEKEANEEAKDNPYSFYHVVKPEIDLLHLSSYYVPEVYEKGASNFKAMIDQQWMMQDETDSMYIYQQEMNGRKQNGLVACAAIDDYFNDVIKKHELTRPDKEEDRKNHVRYGKMNAEPVFFSYKKNNEVDVIVDKIIQQNKPEFDFTAEDGIAHRLWVINDSTVIARLILLFDEIGNTYVADGHHRTAAAALVGKEMRDANPNHSGNEHYNYFLAVHFPDDQLQIMDYNRVVKDLNHLSEEEFLSKLSENFDIIPQEKEIYKPEQLHTFGMYLNQKWYKLEAKKHTYDDSDPIGVLDVTILSNCVLSSLLNIKDLRTDKRIDFVGGLRGLKELEKRVNSGEMKVAFALYPVSMKQLIDIADSGQIMPPKTTWFEPKLRSGLIVHSLK